MPTDCRIRVEQISAVPPYYGDQPHAISVTGRVVRDCPEIRVGVYEHGLSTQALFPEITVPTTTQGIAPGVDPNSPEGDARWTADFAFDPQQPVNAVIRCWGRLRVVAECTGYSQACRVDTPELKIRCKGTFDNGGNGGSGTAGGSPGFGGWQWPNLNLGQCFLAKWAYISLMFAGLMSLFMGVCLAAAGILFPIAGVFFVAAGGALLLWKNGCGVSDCEYWGLLCWIFKWATTAALVLVVVLMCPIGALVMAGYGTVTGWIILRLRRFGCPVPPMISTPP